MKDTDYSKLFIDGREIPSEYGAATLRRHEAGRVFIPSGEIVACDPFFSHTTPFTTRVPPNSYPAILSIAHFGDNDQRVAAAMLKLSDAEPVKWEMALNSVQDITSLEEGEIFGYGVDAGTGCFMDVEAARILTESESHSELLQAEFDKTYVATWSWADVSLKPLSQTNVVAFSTGLGDGVYASYFGFDERGRVTSLVTDFAMFEIEDIS